MFEIVSATVRKNIFIHDMKLADTPTIESRLSEQRCYDIIFSDLNVP